jgi:predicted RNA-binding protein YlxR (DUF448 family)
MAKEKHVPQRTCVGCRSTDAKRQFIRVVRTQEGGVEVDLSGKKAGRGAYVCDRRECWSEAMKGDRLGRALRAMVTPDQRAALEAFASRLGAVTPAVGS